LRIASPDRTIFRWFLRFKPDKIGKFETLPGNSPSSSSLKTTGGWLWSSEYLKNGNTRVNTLHPTLRHGNLTPPLIWPDREDRLVFYHVILSEAKNLRGFTRSFASLRMTFKTIPDRGTSELPYSEPVKRLAISVMFCPPKPKLFDKATSQRACRAALGI
jgi:hypothetical protein